MKKILITTIFILSLFPHFLTAQCYDDCKKGIGNRNIVNEQTVKLIDDRKFKKAYEKIEPAFENDGRLYFDTQHIGVGCFYFYYSYARLASVIDEDKNFKDYLEKARYISLIEMKEKGLIAANFATQIYNNYQQIPCDKLFKKIGGKDGEKWEKYLADLKEVEKRLLLDIKNQIVDLAITDFKLKTNESTVMAQVAIKNMGDIDVVKPFYLKWHPSPQHPEQSILINRLASNEFVEKEFKATFSFGGEFNSTAKVDVINGETNTTNNILEKILYVDSTVANIKYSYTISSTKENINIGEVETSDLDENCVEIEHSFDITSFKNDNSDKVNFIVLNNILLPYITDKELKEKLFIAITGRADGHKFKNSTTHSFGKIGPVDYFSNNDNAWKTMHKLNRIRINEELAFIRAYSTKELVKKYLDLDEDQISLMTETTELLGGAHRRVKLLVCSDDFQVSDIKYLQELSKRELSDDYTPPSSVLTNNKLAPVNFDFSNAKIGDIFPIKDLFFEADKTDIHKKYNALLNDLATELRKNPQLKIEIRGHTNTTPTHEYCDALSQMRADSILEYLVDKGVDRENLLSKGLGKRYPIYNTSQRTQNQRVEIKILNK